MTVDSLFFALTFAASGLALAGWAYWIATRHDSSNHHGAGKP
ncbi:hypothetical protein QO014_002158 [Kaistia dalseonensis]|uniref:Uncharacterized protein n=1 Tax=Kaistia dalseonensis TaxID=410840 RepID=A0ABU0H626_9HYPH|nr:hypothetical protein [Kaistia dalseonensis]